MRKLLLTFAALLPLVAASQPREWNPKPMSEFGNDTVAYIKHNFSSQDENMQAYFKDKTIGEMIPKLGFDVKYVSSWDFKNIKTIMFVAIARKYIRDGVQVSLAVPFSVQSNPAAYNKLKSEGANNVPFDDEVLDLIKDMKIEQIEAIRLIIEDMY